MNKPTEDASTCSDGGGIADAFGGTLWNVLNDEHRAFVARVRETHRLTFQELRRLAEIARDFEIWGEPGLVSWWDERCSQSGLAGPERKHHVLAGLEDWVASLTRRTTRYPAADAGKPCKRISKPVVTRETDKKIWGMCPVASDKTVCCNLRTIDAVENCVFGCSYCTVQTFYTNEVVFDRNFATKLREIPIERHRFYHFGTGQASDSLAWGNKNGVLDSLCAWAADHPNVLLELKTKSDNVRYFTDHGRELPSNVVCSWSLNTPVIIHNEEHFTARLDERIDAARAVADAGVGVAFHFHPMVHYQGWDTHYPRVAATLLERFSARDVRFVSLGSVTLIKPVIRKMRELGNPTKINQVEFVPDPHGKLTYADDVKVQMYRTMYEALAPWRDGVFMYLCMEKRSIWERAFGYAYDSNADFEIDLGRRALPPRS
jgi:spore photoproduct lyase